jgi:hypothetical protein
MDRNEIFEIATLTAQQTLARIKRYCQTYYPPETVAIGLSESKSEEYTACDWYNRRAIDAALKGDIQTAELYLHTVKDETEHFNEFDKRENEIIGSSYSPVTKDIDANKVNKYIDAIKELRKTYPWPEYSSEDIQRILKEDGMDCPVCDDNCD